MADFSLAELDVDADVDLAAILPLDDLDELREELTPLGRDLVCPPHTGDGLDDEVRAMDQNRRMHLDGIRDVPGPAVDDLGSDVVGVEVRDFRLARCEIHPEMVGGQLFAGFSDRNTSFFELRLVGIVEGTEETVFTLAAEQVRRKFSPLEFDGAVHGIAFLMRPILCGQMLVQVALLVVSSTCGHKGHLW